MARFAASLGAQSREIVIELVKPAIGVAGSLAFRCGLIGLVYAVMPKQAHKGDYSVGAVM